MLFAQELYAVCCYIGCAVECKECPVFLKLAVNKLQKAYRIVN